MDEQRKREKRAWESGYLTALWDVRKQLNGLADWVSDLAMAIIEDLPEGDGDEGDKA